MGAIADLAALRTASSLGDLDISSFAVAGISSGGVMFGDSMNPAVYTVAESYNNTHAAALRLRSLGSRTKQLWLIRTEGANNQSGGMFHGVILDRLCGEGGLSATTTTEQVTSIPALPRYTDGAGVMVLAQVSANLNAVGNGFTLNYTNQDGVSGRITPINIPPSASPRPFIVTLQSGDTGVRSIRGITSESGYSSGAWSLMLAKPIAFLGTEYSGAGGVVDYLFGGGITEILDDACLTAIVKSSAFSSTTNVSVALGICEA